jgi:hypothetical protein
MKNLCFTQPVTAVKWLSIGLLALTAAAAAAAQAENVTFSKTDSLHTLTGRAQGSLLLSEDFTTFSEILQSEISTSARGILTPIELRDWPLYRIDDFKLSSAKVDLATRQLQSAQFAGDFKISAERRNFATKTGWLAITNLNIDLVQRTIRGSVSGGNALPQQDNVALWSFGTLHGQGDVGTGLNTNQQDANCEGQTCRMTLSLASMPPIELTNLHLTNEAFNVFSQALALTAGGKAALTEAYFFPGETFTISAVPEPATWGLAVASALSAGAIATLRRKAHKG